MHRSSRFVAVAAVAFALAACSKPAPTATTTDAAVTAAAADAAAAPAPTPTPGTYAVTDAAGKERGITTINADGTYTDDVPGQRRVAGIVKFHDGKTCFDPSGKAPEECYSESARAADGSFTATDASGAVMMVKPKAK